MKNIASKNIVKINEKNYSSVAKFIQEDDAVLTVELYKDGIAIDITGQTISLNCLRPDGIEIEQLNGISINKTLITINFKNNILQVKGDVFCQLALVDSIGGMSTSEFKITVDRKIVTVDSISANDLETINSIKKAEALRVEAENTRKTNETSRANTESARIAAENTRKSNEETRENIENTRKVNETNRVTSENKRVEAENTRKANEETRKTNEIDRSNKFNETETSAKKLIEQMQTTVDQNIATEVIDARGTKTNLKERLNENDSSIQSNANEIKDIILELLNCIKKDGSVELENTLRLIGDWVGVRIANNNGDRGFINISPRIDEEVALQLGVGNVEDISLEYPVMITKTGVRPNTSNNKSLGTSSRPWKDIWVGSLTSGSTGLSKLPNSRVLQNKAFTITWGGSRTSVEIDFPDTFKTEILFLGVELVSHPYSNLSDWIINVRRVTTSKCIVEMNNISSSKPGSGNVYHLRLLAIGY